VRWLICALAGWLAHALGWLARACAH
jgi:hypothetical protein